MESKQLQVWRMWLSAPFVALKDCWWEGSAVMLMKSSTKSSEVSNRGSSFSELGRHPRQGARRSESKSCNAFAGLGQFDIVASIGDCWGSLFGAKKAFSKGSARVSVGTMVLA